MQKVLVGGGLVTMLSAIAFVSMIAGDAAVPVSVVNSATVIGFWGFVAGTLVAIVGGLQRARR